MAADFRGSVDSSAAFGVRVHDEKWPQSIQYLMIPTSWPLAKKENESFV